MVPKKTRDLYQQVAEEKDVSKNLVENLMEFFYKELRDNLTNLKHPRINVPGLGHFVIRKHKGRQKIDFCEKALENHDTSTMKAYYNKKMLADKLEKLQAVNQLIVQEEERKQKFTKDNGKNK